MSQLFEVASLSLDNKVHLLQGDAPPGLTDETATAPVGSVYFDTSGVTWKKIIEGSGSDKWLLESGDATAGILSLDNVPAFTNQVIDSFNSDFAETAVWSVTVTSVAQPLDKEVVIITGSHNGAQAKYSIYSKLNFGAKIPSLGYSVQLLADKLTLSVTAGVAFNVECYRLTAVAKGSMISQPSTGNGTNGTNGIDGKDGKDGKDGLQGPAGITGADGESAYALAVRWGFQGTEAAWLASLRGPKGEDGTIGINGVNGKSAYELALDNGFTGTEAEWLASLSVGTGGGTGGGTQPLTGPSPYITTYLHTFNQASLINSKLEVVHNLGQKYVSVTVCDDTDLCVIPYNIRYVSDIKLEIDFSSFTPIDGTWHVLVVAGSSDKGVDSSILTKGIPVITDTLLDMPFNGSFINTGESKVFEYTVGSPLQNDLPILQKRKSFENELVTVYSNTFTFANASGFIRSHISNPNISELYSDLPIKVAKDTNNYVIDQSLELFDQNSPWYVHKPNFRFAKEDRRKDQHRIVDFTNLEGRIYTPWANFMSTDDYTRTLLMHDSLTDKYYLAFRGIPEGFSDVHVGVVEILEVLPTRFSLGIEGMHPILKQQPITNFETVVPASFTLSFNMSLATYVRAEPQTIFAMYDSISAASGPLFLNGFKIVLLPDNRLQVYMGDGIKHTIMNTLTPLTTSPSYEQIWHGVSIQRKAMSVPYNNKEVWSIHLDDVLVGAYAGSPIANPTFGQENYISIGALYASGAFLPIPVFNTVGEGFDDSLLSDLSLTKGVTRPAQLDEAYLAATNNIGEGNSSFVFN